MELGCDFENRFLFSVVSVPGTPPICVFVYIDIDILCVHVCACVQCVVRAVHVS